MLRCNQESLPLGTVNAGEAVTIAQPVIIVPTPAWQESMRRTTLGQSRSLNSSMMPQQVPKHLKNEGS